MSFICPLVNFLTTQQTKNTFYLLSLLKNLVFHSTCTNFDLFSKVEDTSIRQ